MDLINYSEKLFQYLKDRGVKFTEAGYPIIEESMLLKRMPEQLLPFDNTYAAKDKSKVLLVSFCNDEVIYKRLFSIEKDLLYYKQFMGFGGFDLTPRINWDIKLQKFNLVINMMANVYLALNGVKLMPNFRTGCLQTMDIFKCYPRNSWYTVGTLGCAKGHVKINEMYLRTKLLITNPEMLIYYGKLKLEYANILNEFGIDYKVFPDFQRISRGKGVA